MVNKRPYKGTEHFLLHFVNTYKNMSKKIKIVYLKNHLDRNIFSDSDIKDFIDTFVVSELERKYFIFGDLICEIPLMTMFLNLQ